MSLASVDQVVQIQAVITGRLIDSISSSAPATRTLLTLEYRRAGASAYRPCPLIQRMGAQGYFGFFATRGDLFAQRLPVPDFEFRLLAQTQGYQPLEHLFNLSGAHLTPENAELTLIGAPRTVRRLPGPPVGLILELAPQPLTLEGQVLRDGDPDQPVEGVSLEISAPEPRGPVLSDATGRFRLPNIPVFAQVTLTAREDGASQSQVVRLDYGRPVNSVTVSL